MTGDGRPTPTTVRVTCYALVSVAIVMLGLSLAATFRMYSSLPYWDQWATVGELEQFVEEGPSVRWFWAQHNEHRLAVPRVFFLLDAFVFGGRNVFLLVSIYWIQLVHAALLIGLARNLGLRGTSLVATGAMVAGLLINPVQISNFVFGFQVQFVAVYLLASVASCAAGISVDRDGRGRGWFALALLTAVATSYTMSSGIVIWPTLLVLLLTLRPVPRRAVLAVLFVGLATLASYLFHYATPTHHTNPWAAMQHPVSILHYAATYLGSPLAFVSKRIAAPFGGLGLIMLLALLVRSRTRGFQTPGAFACLGAMTFVAGGAFMTALGRLDFGIDQALSRRYATPALVFWACALILTVVRVRDSSWLASQPRRRAALALAALVAVLVMARAGIRSTRGYQSFPEMYRRAEVAVLSRELDPEVLGEVSPFDMSYMERRIGFLERQGWSVFSTFDGRVLESGSAPSE